MPGFLSNEAASVVVLLLHRFTKPGPDLVATFLICYDVFVEIIVQTYLSGEARLMVVVNR